MFEYKHIFDEAKQKWVLRKLPVDPTPPAPARRKVHNFDHGNFVVEHGYHVVCLNCGYTYGAHTLGWEYIRCPAGYDGDFEW